MSANEAWTIETPGAPERAETAPQLRWLDAFPREEIEAWLELRDGRSWLSLATNWGLIAASFALVATWPGPLTVVAALFVIGGRQLGLSVVMHEAAHRTLFRNRRLNDFAGNWLAAYPVWTDLGPYRRYHLQHHAWNWTEKDPDLDLARPFPITRASLWRKLWRDLSGQTGWKRARATWRRDLSRSAGKTRRQGESALQALRGVSVTNLALLGGLTAVGRPELYLLWVGAWLTTYSLCMRIRAIAEHSMVRDPSDPFQNARTTLAGAWERLLLAPNRVNFHLEHHLLMTVPHYNLPRMHRSLRERGLLDDAAVAPGYAAVLRLARSRTSSRTC